MKTAATYLRVSTAEQVLEGYSLDAQKEKLRAYCFARDYRIVGEYIDPGFSGSNIERPAMQKLIRDIGKIDVVLVYKLDRLSRSQKDTLYLIEDVFLKNGTDLISITESFDTTTPFGRAMVGILSVFAQLERENIRDRMTSGRVAKIKTGKHNMQWTLPVGYDRNGDDLVINEYEAMQIRMLFDMYISGVGAPTIAYNLNAAGYRHKYGPWNDTRVTLAIRNKVYIGMVRFSNIHYPGLHQPIISQEIFDAANVNRLRKTPLKNGSTCLFAGLLFCGVCGCMCSSNVRTGKTYLYYRCHNSRRSGKTRRAGLNKFKPCTQMNIREEKVLDALSTVMKRWSELVEVQIQKETVDWFDEAATQDRLKSIDIQLSRLIDLYQLDKMPIEKVRERSDALMSEQTLLLASIRDHELPVGNLLQVSISEAKDWETFSKDERRAFLVKYVDKIMVINGEELELEILFRDNRNIIQS